MSIIANLDTLLLSVKNRNSPNYIISDFLDLTLLDPLANEASLLTLKEQGITHHCAAVCILPKHLPYFKNTEIPLATVVNFPEGNAEINTVLQEINEALENGASEIDYVFSYQSYLNGQYKSAIDACARVVEHCHASGLMTKIILETGSFTDLEVIYQASVEIIKTGCDFIKTSTGKIPHGASLSAAFAMLSAIKDTQSSCGIKFSGGIRTREQALTYLHLLSNMFEKTITSKWVRFGTSRLLS